MQRLIAHTVTPHYTHIFSFQEISQAAGVRVTTALRVQAQKYESIVTSSVLWPQRECRPKRVIKPSTLQTLRGSNLGRKKLRIDEILQHLSQRSLFVCSFFCIVFKYSSTTVLNPSPVGWSAQSKWSRPFVMMPDKYVRQGADFHHLLLYPTLRIFIERITIPSHPPKQTWSFLPPSLSLKGMHLLRATVCIYYQVTQARDIRIE